MFTVCPKCTLTLAVTAADLRIGQGYVRCGRCANVFNALLTLSEQPSEAPVASEPRAGLGAGDSLATTPASASIKPESGAALDAAPDPPASAAADSDYPSRGDIESNSSTDEGTETVETIVLEGDGIMQTEEFVSGEAFDDEIAALTERLGAASEDEEISFDMDLASGSAAPPADPAAEPAAQAPAAADESLAQWAPEFAGQSLGAPRRPWIAACALLALLLGMQAVHHWRNDLATSPRWNAPLTRLYAAFGAALTPHWDLSAYDVRQQGALADPAQANAISVRLSIANRGARAQPPPVLRLTLLDRYGKRVAARDVTPAEYLPSGQATLKFMSADQRIDSVIAVQDPGPDASSFEIDVCLRSGDGSMRCAGDTPAVAAR